MKNRFVILAMTVLLGACVTTQTPAPRVIERMPPNEVTAPPPPPLPTLTQADLVRLAKQPLPAESIIARIKETRTRLRLSATDIVSLKTQGVPLVVLEHLLDSDRLAVIDQCTADLNRHQEEARANLQQAVQQGELMGWQRCQMNYPMFPGWRAFPHRH